MNNGSAQSVREVIGKEVGLAPESLPGDGELSALPGMDSAKLLEVVSTLEAAHGVSIDDDLLFSIETVDDLIRALDSRLAVDAPAAEPGQ
ncbi:acyl carrier protein [Streptomyces sp. NPDC006372]|uniref:acyl carrier protein n=1 Tax=Streptomyces sp. NPDC006372 TaxID=3155599 RepID=UPI0033B59839